MVEAAELMTSPVAACGPDDTLDRAVERMRARRCGSVLALDGRERVIGIVTDRDVCLAARRFESPLHEVKVRRVMTVHVEVCGPRETLAAVQQRLRAARVRRLPVADAQGRALGIISVMDLAVEAARSHVPQAPETSTLEVRRRHDARIAGTSAGQVLVTLARIGEPERAWWEAAE